MVRDHRRVNTAGTRVYCRLLLLCAGKHASYQTNDVGRDQKITGKHVNAMNRYFSLPLTICLYLFIGCGSLDDNQPAQLISTVPAEGELIEIDGLIHLCFDKPVRHVGVDDYAARNRHGKLSTAAWEIEVNRLQLWDKYFGFHPEKLVELEITFEDDAGRHHVKLNLRRPGLHINGDPLEIAGANVSDGSKDVDPELQT